MTAQIKLAVILVVVFLAAMLGQQLALRVAEIVVEVLAARGSSHRPMSGSRLET